MKTITLFLLLTLPFVGISQDSTYFDYITLTQVGDNLWIDTPTKDKQQINIKNQKSKWNNDWRPLLLKIQEYEKKGWELVTNSVFPDGTWICNYALMRRKIVTSSD
jgi:hypothetical protein